MAIETVNITSNRILLKNNSGIITFDSNNLYLKTDPTGQFLIGGSLAAPQLWGGGAVTALGNNGYGHQVSTAIYQGPITYTQRYSGTTILLPKRDNYTLFKGRIQTLATDGVINTFNSANQVYSINGKPSGAFTWQGILSTKLGAYVKLLVPIFEMPNTASQSVQIFLPFNDTIYNSMAPYSTAATGSGSFSTVGGTASLTWWDWGVGTVKQPQTLSLAVSI